MIKREPAPGIGSGAAGSYATAASAEEHRRFRVGQNSDEAVDLPVRPSASDAWSSGRFQYLQYLLGRSDPDRIRVQPLVVHGRGRDQRKALRPDAHIREAARQAQLGDEA